MHRTAASAARNTRLLRHHRPQHPQNPSNICPFCQHRSLSVTPQHRQEPRPDDEPSDKLTPTERKRRESLSPVQKTLLARDIALGKLRNKLWKGAPPGADDPYTGENREPPPSRAVRPRTDEDLIMVGGEEGEAAVDEAAVDADVRAYERRTALEERARFQQAVDEAPQHTEYVPATRWEGLEVVGGEKEWAVGAGWKKSKTFRSFIPSQKIMSPTLLLLGVYRALVEVWFAASTGRDPMRLRRAGPEDVRDLSGVAHMVGIKGNEDERTVTITFPDEETRERLVAQIDRRAAMEQEQVDEEVDGMVDELAEEDETSEERSLAEELAPAEEITEDPADEWTPRRLLKQIGTEWKHTPLSSPTIKLAFSRRLTQLTGHTLSSHNLNHAKVIQSVNLILLASVTEPTTTYESLVGTQYATENPHESVKPKELEKFDPSPENEKVIGPLPDEKYGIPGLFAGLGNVQISGRRVTPIDREKEVGRWKVIERELRAKGLPVTGLGGVGGIEKVRPAHKPWMRVR